MLKILLSILVIALGVFVVAVASRPDDFKITRSGIVSAPPAVVFAQVNNLHNWNAWSPWAKLDPNAKNSFDGPESGYGASLSWSGNNEVGEGRMTIVESRPDEIVKFKLEFQRPFQAVNDAEFTFKPEAQQTIVTWTMSGKNSFIAKAVGLFLDCDKMVGEQFEKGLANLKSVAEKAAPESASS